MIHKEPLLQHFDQLFAIEKNSLAIILKKILFSSLSKLTGTDNVDLNLKTVPSGTFRRSIGEQLINTLACCLIDWEEFLLYLESDLQNQENLKQLFNFQHENTSFLLKENHFLRIQKYFRNKINLVDKKIITLLILLGTQ